MLFSRNETGCFWSPKDHRLLDLNSAFCSLSCIENLWNSKCVNKRDFDTRRIIHHLSWIIQGKEFSKKSKWIRLSKVDLSGTYYFNQTIERNEQALIKAIKRSYQSGKSFYILELNSSKLPTIQEIRTEILTTIIDALKVNFLESFVSVQIIGHRVFPNCK